MQISILISFICLVLLFLQSCYGLKCFSCESMTHSECDDDGHINNDLYLKDNDSDHVCTKSVLSRELYRRTARGALAKQLVPHLFSTTNRAPLGWKFDITTCTTDGCNA